MRWGLIMGAVASLAVIGGAVVLLRRRQEQSQVVPIYAGGSRDFYRDMPVLKPGEESVQPVPGGILTTTTDFLGDWRKINPQPQPMPVPKPEESVQPVQGGILTTTTDFLGDFKRINSQPKLLERVTQPIFRRID